MLSVVRKRCWDIKESFPVGALGGHISSGKEYRLLSNLCRNFSTLANVNPVKRAPSFFCRLFLEVIMNSIVST